MSLYINSKNTAIKNNPLYVIMIYSYTMYMYNTSTRYHGVITPLKLQMTHFFIILPVITLKKIRLYDKNNENMTKYSDVIGRKYMYMYFAHLLELLLFFFGNCDLNWDIYYLHCKCLQKTWRTGARLVGFVINEKKDIHYSII